MPSRNTIEVIINATDNASRVFNSLGDNSQKLGGIITAGIVGGLTAATVAITGFAAKGLSEFQSFQQGMAEVFTLIPDASEDMKNKLDDDVKYLASRFGILTDQQIPALYQAISAGVPSENVFTFLETANKAAIAGATTLETAVDGITSVINAYGADVLSAAQASDIMFTGVRLGKTDFNQLSQSLFQVIPSASGLGVAFGDVTAALAAITAQGTPTSVATTQLRQLFVELSKDGGKASDTFKEMAGKTFKDFIASGGNVQDALQLMEKAAQESGLGISDMFSSVEAGNAALQLTGKGAERFTDFLMQMTDATGATEKAFETMSETMQFQANRLQGKLGVMFTEIGEKLAPIATQAFEDLGDVVSLVTGIITGEFSKQSASYEDIIAEFGKFGGLAVILIDIGDEIRRITGLIGRFINGVRGGVPFLDNLKGLIAAIFPPEIATTINKIITGFNDLWLAIRPIIDTIINFIRENVKLEDVLIAIGIAISSFVIPAIIAIGAVIAPVIATFALMVGAVTLLRKAWETDFLGIQTFVTEKLIPALQMLADWFIKDALPKAIDFVQNVAIPALQLFVNWLSGIWESVKPALESLANWFINDALPSVLNFITGTVIPGIGSFIQLLINIWNFVKPHLMNLYNWFVTDALPALVRFVETTVIPGVQSFVDLLLGIWDTVRPILENLLNWFITDGLPLLVSFVEDVLIPGVQGFIDLLLGIWETVSPILSSLLDWFITTGLPLLVGFVEDTLIPGVQGFIDLLKGIWTNVQAPLNSLKDGISRIFSWIKTNVIDPIIVRIEEFVQTLRNLGIIQGDTQATVNAAVANAASNPSSAVSNPAPLFGLPGAANGLSYAPRDMGINIHKGERVLTKDENEAYTNGNNQSNSPMIAIENLVLGDIQNQSDANEKARMFVNGLRAQGMEI